MPILTPIEVIKAELANIATRSANYTANACISANSMVEYMLSLDDESLTEWLNSQPPEEMIAQFTAHGGYGASLNAAAAYATQVLPSTYSKVIIPEVDVRSVPEKLAARGRLFSFENGVFSVTTPPPEPPVEEP